MAVNPAVDMRHLQEYIRAVSGVESGPARLPGGPYPFITISRQTGSGGHSLAEAILHLMERQPDRKLFGGWQIFDQELCRKVLEDPNMKVPLEWLLAERFRGDTDDFLSQIFAGTTPQLAVFHRTAKLIHAFAGAGKVIVVGRAGAFLTRDLPSGIHVRLVAPRALRVQSMIRQFKLSDSEADRQVSEQDASRALLVRSCFNGKDIEDPLYYDSVWNTSRVSPTVIAGVLAGLVRQKAALHEPR